MHLIGGIFFYIAGLATTPYLYEHNLLYILPFILGILCIVATGRKSFLLVFAVFLFSFGVSQYFLAIAPGADSRALSELNGQQLRLQGVVSSINSRPKNGLTVELESVTIKAHNSSTALHGNIRISIDEHDAELYPGELVMLHTRLRVPTNFETPGAFDYDRHLTRRKISATGFIRKSSGFARIDTDPGWKPVLSIRVWRNRIRNQIISCLPEESAPFINALAIGDRGAMPDDRRKLLSECGITHLFAISGLHLGLVGALLYFLFRSIYLRFLPILPDIPPRQIIAPLVLPLLLVYMIITGSAISTLRALTMIGAATVLCCYSRRTHPRDILATAALTILIFDPLALFEPSFQLSFAGAGGIILFLPFWQSRITKLPRPASYPLSLLAVTFSASLATAPFVLLHFHLLAPAGLLLNLIAVPLISFIVIPLVLGGILLTPFSYAASAAFFKTAAAILMPVISLAERFLATNFLPAKTIYLPPFTIGAVSLLVLSVLVQKRIPAKIKTVLIAGLCIVLFPIGTWSSKNNAIRVTSLDVGQGDSTLLQLPGGLNYLIDGGGLYSESFDTGERLVAPAIGYLGVDKLDAVILTHDHPDHRKGLVHILENFPVGEFWCTRPEQELHFTLRRHLEKKSIPVRVFPPGWSSLATREAVLKVFVPDDKTGNRNNTSLVLYAGLESDGVLLTGDLESHGIRKLASSRIPGPVSLLKIPHHGSRKSDPSLLLEKFSPEVSFLSVGRDNHYNLPHPLILHKLANSATTLYRTDINGSLRFISEGHGWAITHWKKGLFR